MITDGYESESHWTRQIIDSLFDEDDYRDPTTLYVRATSLQAQYSDVVNTLSELRAAAVSRLSNDGMSYAQVAAHLGISRGRVQQMIAVGREAVRLPDVSDAPDSSSP